MEVKSRRWPKYCGPHEMGYGYVWWNGSRVYFAPHKHGTSESLQAYTRWCKVNVDGLDPDTPIEYKDTNDHTTVAYLLLEHLKAARSKFGTESVEFKTYRLLTSFLSIVKDDKLLEFGPRRLEWVIAKMIQSARWNLTTIQKNLGKIKRIWKWGVRQEIVGAEQYHALLVVEAPRAGTPGIRPKRKVNPASVREVIRTAKALSPILRTMVLLQLLTGMRSENLVLMQWDEIDQSDDIWKYVPSKHKTEWKDKNLWIPLGPWCQRLLRPFEGCESFLFSPRESKRWYQDQRAKERKSKPTPRQEAERGRISPLDGDHYAVSSYANAVARGCKKAGVPHWHPHQLRHTRATIIRRKFGIEAAQMFLGHTKIDVTQLYAERDWAKVVEVARRIS